MLTGQNGGGLSTGKKLTRSSANTSMPDFCLPRSLIDLCMANGIDSGGFLTCSHPTLGDPVQVVAQLDSYLEATLERPSPSAEIVLHREKSSSSNSGPRLDESDVLYLKDEPVISTGRDVSRFVVDIRDDGDQALTFRSLFLGTLFAAMGAALCQIYLFKPTLVSVSTVFLLLLVYCAGNAWAVIIPRCESVEGTFLAFLGPFFRFINPGPFTLKEHVVSSLVASTAASGSSAVLNFAVQRLYYDTRVEATTAVLATFSTACFGYGLVGILRPLAIYPSEMVYWPTLPTVSVFQALHFENDINHKRLKLFWTTFTGMFCYEIIPAYIFPLLNGVNIFCLASQKASHKTLDTFTNLFGGAGGNEGLGLFSLSFDWQYIGSVHMSLPLIQQANSWIGFFFCYVAISTIYYSNTWNSLAFPMLSSSIFSVNGTLYPQSYVLDSTFRLNQTALDEVGLPSLTGSNLWGSFVSNLTIGGLISHCILFWGGHARESVAHARKGTQPDPHYQAMKKYKEAPWWWYAILLLLSFFAGLVVIVNGQTTLPWWSYIIALTVGSLLAPFAILFSARLGNITPSAIMDMVAGAINPGQPLANLYFSMWSHDVIYTSIKLAQDLKMSQYLKIPPRVMFLTQIWGTIVGVFVNYVVMISVVDAQREILISPKGTNIWSGQLIQGWNSSAVVWSLAKQLYGLNGPYWIIPFALVIGIVPTFIQWLIWKKRPTIGHVQVNTIVLPVIYLYAGWMTFGVNSVIMSSIIVGLVSQLWLRRYHPGWYKKYNYILGGALDGGAQMMVFILSFSVFGAAGVQRPFPVWGGNPTKGNADYCNGNGALG